MHAAGHHPRFTLEEYLEFELDHEGKFEYAHGQILAMAGAPPRHNVLAVNVVVALHARLAGRCRGMGSDQRIATGDGIYTYPDGVVVCGRMELTTYKGTATLHNPGLLVEVLSRSTRQYDLGEKLEHYQTIPALQHVLLLEQQEVHVRHVRRTAEGWETRHFRSTEDAIDLMDLTLPLGELYGDLPEE